ncbi:MAG: response regulator transcription factor [Lachnospiraceae bacterium]|nr:response regulator transcription factor [Lachnospiraceae bacterium]
MRILLAEDEEQLSRALTAILKHNGYTVDAVADGTDAYDYARAEEYDGLILDIMMPGMEGTEVLKRLRAEGISTPALFLTAKSQIEDRIAGLDIGADDYLTKPFDMGELLARVRAMIRRKENYAPPTLVCGNLSLDRAEFSLSTPGHPPAHLAAKEFQMLELLMTTPGRLISADLFLDRVWPEGEADVNTVWVYLSNLRKKLAALEADVEIRATRGVGYSMTKKEA